MGAYIFAMGLLVVFDQFFKIWAYNATANGSISLIPGLFKISYVENRGAAFNLFSGQRWILIAVTALVLAFLLYLIFTKKIPNDTALSGVMLITSGGLSNLADRIFRGYVIDYLDFSALFNYPVFNLADVCVVIGTAMLLYYVFVIEPKEKKAAEEKGAQ